MKRIILIDDYPKINQVQSSEINKIKSKIGVSDLSVDEINLTILKGDFSIDGKPATDKKKKELDDFLKDILVSKTKYEKIEIVVDLYLDKNEQVEFGGLKLIKYCLDNCEFKKCFDNNEIVIVITSALISIDYESLAKPILGENTNHIFCVYRPIIVNNSESINSITIEKNLSCYPRFATNYKTKNDEINKLLLNNTAYGNYFGLIFAILVSWGVKWIKMIHWKSMFGML